MIVDLLHRLFGHERPPSLAPLKREAEYQRERASDVIEQMDQDHDAHLARMRRDRADVATALLRARDAGGPGR